MSKKYLVPIDMNGLEIQNFKAHNLATAPTGSDGKIYFNTVDHKLYYYNGTSWVDLTASITVDSAMSASSTNPVQNKVINTALSGKVDTVSGKGLSTNDYTTADKNKLDSIGVGTSALITQGTDTTNRVWQPKILHDYIASAIGGVDAMRFKGTIGTGGDITALPTSGVKVGDTYRVITAGTYAGQVCEVGDLIIATATTPTWTVAQTNIEGAITSISGTSPVAVTGSGSSRTISVPNASTSEAGLMSADDKTKLNGIASGAEVNVQSDWNQTTTTADDYIKNKPTIPTLKNVFGKVKVGSTTIEADTTQDTLELAAGSNITLTPDTANDKVTIAATDTTYSDFTGATATAAGTHGLVPAPYKASKPADVFEVLSGFDGWQTFKISQYIGSGPSAGKLYVRTGLYDNGSDTVKKSSSVALPTATVSSDGVMSADDKTKLDGLWEEVGSIYFREGWIEAGQTSCTIDASVAELSNSAEVLSVTASIPDTNEPVVIDWTVDGSNENVVASIASAISHDIVVKVLLAPTQWA